MIKKCAVHNCQLGYYSKGYCQSHYDQIRRHGALGSRKKIRSTCSILECKKISESQSLCAMHYRRLRVHGDPNFINPRCNRDGNYLKRARIKTKEWKKRNWTEYKAYLNARKKRVKAATPKWADIKTIQEFYVNCPKDFHVDHIIPLNGKNVSGLHILSNLQYLPKKENLKKGNKLLIAA